MVLLLLNRLFFTTKANEIQGYLLTSLPFNTETSKINIHHMEVHSNESGISIEGGLQVDNFFGSYRNREGLYHYTGYDENQRVILRNHLKKIFKKKVYVIMIVNDSDYGGSGEFISDKLLSVVQSTYDTQYGVFRELVLHESVIHLETLLMNMVDHVVQLTSLMIGILFFMIKRMLP